MSRKQTLVIAPQWIGDAVMTQPLMAILAERGEVITVAALPWVAPVYRAMPEVAEVIALPFAHGRLDWSARRVLGQSLRGRFHVAYVLPNSIKAALLPWFAAVPVRIGYHGEGRWGLLNRRLPSPQGRPPMVPFYAALASLGPRADLTESALDPGVLRPQMQVSAERRAEAAALLASLADGEQGLNTLPTPYWVFAPGAEYGPAKCWPATHYAALARSLHARDGAKVVLLGSGKEAALIDGIAAEAPEACIALAGRTSLDVAMALIAGARGVVSNDSGLMHVAAAFGLPQVAVFGSTSPHHTPPINERARVLWLKDELQLDCAPCFERTCKFGHYRCLTEVAPERVLSALETALDPSLSKPSR
ncbi:lipopolysaccharide heptosyltransferase II [Leptothrix ochracea]|uniref:lipopolysaccharide heptosyltransferase II n=1 Tax=Leptothrix ochracea TaxID=735331 RepID=UPI0034E2584C